MYGALFWKGGGGWKNILVGWGWVEMNGGECGWVHCLIILNKYIESNKFDNVYSKI